MFESVVNMAHATTGGHFWIAGVSGVVKLRVVPYRGQDTPESDALAPHLLFDKLSDRIAACTSVPEGGDEGSQKVDHRVQSLAHAAQRTSDLIELLDIVCSLRLSGLFYPTDHNYDLDHSLTRLSNSIASSPSRYARWVACRLTV